jgi:multiple sugar transport system substrate-binding protein
MLKKVAVLFLALLMLATSLPALAEEPIELELWHYFSGNDSLAFVEKMEAFNTIQSEIKLNIQFVSRDDLLKQYTMGAVSGELPDIGMVDNPDMAAFIQMGVFADITEYLEAWGELSNFFVGPLSSATQDGRIYGLPQNSNCLALYYDVDMLEAAGVEVPTTWSELEAAAAALTNPETGTYGLAISAVKNEEGTFQFMPWFISAGGSLENLSGQGCVDALSFLSGLVENGYMSRDIINWTQGDANNQFIAGHAAMQVNGPWQIPSLQADAPDKNYAVALVPKADNGIYASVLGGENFGVTAACENVEAAVKVLQFLLDADVNADTCLGSGKFSPRADSMASRPEWSEDPILSVFSEAMQYAMPRGPHPRWPEISAAICVAEHEVFTGTRSVEEALTDAEAKVTELLSK